MYDTRVESWSTEASASPRVRAAATVRTTVRDRQEWPLCARDPEAFGRRIICSFVYAELPGEYPLDLQFRDRDIRASVKIPHASTLHLLGGPAKPGREHCYT